MPHQLCHYWSVYLACGSKNSQRQPIGHSEWIGHVDGDVWWHSVHAAARSHIHRTVGRCKIRAVTFHHLWNLTKVEIAVDMSNNAIALFRAVHFLICRCKERFFKPTY